MGCCEPVLAPIQNYYTKYQVDRLISGVTVSGVTEEQMNNAIESAKTEIEAEMPSLDGYATTAYVNTQISSQTSDFVTSEQLSSYTYDKSEIDSEIASAVTDFITIEELSYYVNELRAEIETLREQVSGCCDIPPTPTPVGTAITYTADDKLNVRSIDFMPRSTAETFSNGVGVIEFGTDVAVIHGGAFAKFSGMTSVNLPITISTIYGGVFSECHSLSSFTMPSGVTVISDNLFYKDSDLTTVELHNNITSIGDAAFSYCTSLSSITIPSSVTSIGAYSFSYCTSLSSITIPSAVTSISNDAFIGCTSLTSIIVEATTPPTLGSSVFFNTNDAPIYVPLQSLEAYKTADGWSTYSDRIQPIQ